MSRRHAARAEGMRTDRAGGMCTDRAGGVRRLPRTALIGLVQLYRTWISPVRPPTCRFIPTCSEYAVEALTRHGAVKGASLSMIRLLKCGPWHRGGWNPVPE